MTDEEVQPFVGKPARVTLADGRVLAGILKSEGGHGHGHAHFAVQNDVIHGSAQITNVEDASDDPAAAQ